MSFSSNMQKAAKKLTGKYGNSVTLIDRYDCNYDPTIGDIVCTEDRHSRRGAISSYTVAELTSEYVNVDDLRLTIQSNLDITKEWEVEYHDKRWKIVSMSFTTTQDADIIKVLQIRA